MSYVIPTPELSVAKLEFYRNEAKKAALKRAQDLKLATSMDELVFREANPGTDLSQPAGSGYTNETYLTGAAAINTWTSVYDTAGVARLGNRQIAVFYKVFVVNANPATTAVRFRLGLTGATTLGWFFVEQVINTALVPEAWFSEPVVYNPDQFMFIEFYPMAAVPAAGERLGFGCFIAEPIGESIS